ncbi:Hok/Gef family protein [Escherichia coli]
MLNTCRVPLTDRKVKEKRAMKQHKAMIVALIVICITAVVAALVTKKTSVRFTSELARRRLPFDGSRIRVRATAGSDPISANLRVEPSEECDASVPR